MAEKSTHLTTYLKSLGLLSLRPNLLRKNPRNLEPGRPCLEHSRCPRAAGDPSESVWPEPRRRWCRPTPTATQKDRVLPLPRLKVGDSVCKRRPVIRWDRQRRLQTQAISNIVQHVHALARGTTQTTTTRLSITAVIKDLLSQPKCHSPS